MTGYMRSGSKFKNIRVEVDGIKFHSKAESRRYLQLKALQQASVLSGLELQPRFPLAVNGIHICTYVADFRYQDVATGQTIIEDVKGARTTDYKHKSKLLLAVHGIQIREIQA
jgi:hypothetical protein